MRPARPAVAVAVLLLAGATASIASPASASAAADPDLSGQAYVALGDSYSAGFGLVPYTDRPAPGCYQAEANYPHLIAAEFGLLLDDRTCSGAITRNIIDTPQLTITGQGTAPVQSDSLTSDTRLVTVTIGGNDLGFADIAESCIAESATGPLVTALTGLDFQTCREFYVRTVDGFTVDLLRDRIEQNVAPLLDETFALIAQKAPSATVIVVGYPAISPDFANVPAGGCYRSPLGPTGLLPPFPQNSFPFTDVDTLYLHETEVQLDAAIRTSAESNGAIYVSTLAQTVQHSPCATDAPYVNGITLTDDGTIENSTPIPDTGYGVVLGALHPNSAGVAFLQSQVAATIRSTLTGVGGPTAVPSDPPAPAASDPQLAASGAPIVGWTAVAGAAIIAAGMILVRLRRGSGARRDPQLGKRRP